VSIVQRGSVLEAADAAASDLLGSAVALSADGTILAVGAQQWEGGSSNQGGVYIYDWSGSAWVARGSVLVASDAASDDYFGSAVALSDDGSVLAVGATGRDYLGSSRGAVYIYDWSGSAWVQRGSVLVASDADINDNFGSSLALSASGSVLAVGARAWEGAATNQGGVYVYDWTTVWTQRGSVLVASDAAADDVFGYGVALSDDGAILAVGAATWEGGVSNQGAVYLYDWSGSAWVERAGIVTASDAVSGKTNFGNSVALSASGAVLAVGAISWDGGSSDQGAIYLYDWSGSAWVEREILTAGDAAASDNFGFSVALSDNAAVMVVGAISWEGSATNQGGVYTFDVLNDLYGAASAVASASATLTGGHIPVPLAGAAAAVAGSTATLTAGQFVSIPTSLTVSYPTGTISIPTSLAVSENGSISIPTVLAVISATQEPHWRALCLIDGVDVSARLEGQARVPADEGAARVAQLAIRPPSGVISPLDYVGKTITLDYVWVIGGVDVPRRLFTGRIDTPDYDLASGLLRLDCVDDIQNRVAALTRPVIDSLIGGRYTEAVQGEITDNWDYAQALLSTVAASLDAGASGGMRVTPWELAATWATYTASELLYQQSKLTLPQRSTIVNRVDIAYEYRYPRLRQRYTTLGWSGTHVDMPANGWQYPKQQDILGAAGGSGWSITLGIFWPAPAAIPHSSGGFIHPPEGSIDMAVLHLTQRHSQTVTEAYALTVTAPESVAANGELPRALRGALEESFDGSAWESALDVDPLMPSGGEQDYAPNATRADSDYAIQTLLDQANVAILGSHRGARVSNAILCNPDLDLDKRVALSTADMSVVGKVASLTHILDFDAGSAITEFSIACFGAGGAGIITPDTLEPPAEPAAAAETQAWAGEVPPLYVHTFGVNAYSDSIMGLLLDPPETISVDDVPGIGTKSYPNPYYVAGGYPVTGFRVQMPGVVDADRNPLEKPVATAYQTIIPTDTLTFTVP
jgi:hypothetical protein